MRIVIDVDLEKSPIVKYTKKLFAVITQRKKINALEEKIRTVNEENQELQIKLIKYEKEASAALEMALEEENKRKEIERGYQKEVIKLKEQLEKLCIDPNVKEITKRSHKEIETLMNLFPPERTKEPILKISHVHPRDSKYISFLNSLKKIPYIIEIVDKEAKEAKKSRINRVEPKEIVLIYTINSCGYRISLKTTAQDMLQQYFIAAYIKNNFL